MSSKGYVMNWHERQTCTKRNVFLSYYALCECSQSLTNLARFYHVQSVNHPDVGQGMWVQTLRTQMNSLNRSFLILHMMHVIPPTQVQWPVMISIKQIKTILNIFRYSYKSLSSLGEVLASTIMQYLQTMTGQSPEQGRLTALHRLLDPDRQDPHVSRETFHSTMREWIVQCSRDRWEDIRQEEYKRSTWF